MLKKILLTSFIGIMVWNPVFAGAPKLCFLNKSNDTTYIDCNGGTLVNNIANLSFSNNNPQGIETACQREGYIFSGVESSGVYDNRTYRRHQCDDGALILLGDDDVVLIDEGGNVANTGDPELDSLCASGACADVLITEGYYGRVVTVLWEKEDSTSALTPTSVSYVENRIDTTQVKIPAAGANGVPLGDTVVTYTGTAGQIGERGIYNGSQDYDASRDGDKIITAGALNGAINSISTVDTNELTCANPGTCDLWTITAQTAYGTSSGGGSGTTTTVDLTP